jgi:hypothetical protein
LTATGFSGNSRPRRLKIAEPSGCFAVRDSEPARLGKPSGKTWEVHSRVADRRVVNREQQTGSTQDRTALGVLCFSRSECFPLGRLTRKTWEVHSPHADQFGMSTGRASRTCLLNSGLPERECGASPRHSAIHARVAQREPAALYPASH